MLIHSNNDNLPLENYVDCQNVNSREKLISYTTNIIDKLFGAYKYQMIYKIVNECIKEKGFDYVR